MTMPMSWTILRFDALTWAGSPFEGQELEMFKCKGVSCIDSLLEGREKLEVRRLGLMVTCRLKPSQ